MTDFSTPRRMSPGAFVIMFLKSFKDIVGAAFVALVYMLYNSHDSGGRLFWKFALPAGTIQTYPFHESIHCAQKEDWFTDFYPCAVSLSTLLQATSRKWS